MDIFGVGSPVRRYRRETACHRLHQRHVPALTAAGRNVAIGRAVERPELIVGELSIENVGDLSPAVLQLKPADLVADAQHAVAVEDLADESYWLPRGESVVEDLQEHPGFLALTPFEVR